jgi:hypothetical protein
MDATVQEAKDKMAKGDKKGKRTKCFFFKKK